MIAGDYLYTNYICRIAMLLNGKAYSDDIPDGKFLTVKIGKEEFFFRYDDNEKGFMLVNQYREKDIELAIKSLIAAFIYKGLRDKGIDERRIIINGEEVEINNLTLCVLMIVWKFKELIDKHPNRTVKCRRNCVFKKICLMGNVLGSNSPSITINDVMGSLYNYYHADVIHMHMIYLLDDLHSAIACFIDDYFNMEAEKRRSIREKETRRKIVEDIGYKKADVVFRLANYVLEFYPLSNLNVNVSDYGGYLVKKNGYVYPSDKFWNIFLGRSMEENIGRIYSKMNGKATYKERRVIRWEF